MKALGLSLDNLDILGGRSREPIIIIESSLQIGLAY